MEVKNPSKKHVTSKRIATDWSHNSRYEMNFAQVSDVNSIHENIKYTRTPEKDKKVFPPINDVPQYKDSYEQMQKIVMEENNNLKRQIQFLAGEIRKYLKRQRYEKEATQLLRDQYRQIKQKNDRLIIENMQIKQCIKSQMLFLINSFKSNSIQQIYSEVQAIIKQLNSHLHIDIQENLNRKYKKKLKDTNSTKSYFNTNSNAQEEIDILNEKFDDLMNQYSETHQESTREKCIKIAKQMHKLKKKFYEQNNLNINLNVNSNLRLHVNQENIKCNQHHNFYRPETDRVFHEPYISQKHYRKPTQEQLSEAQKLDMSDIRRQSYTKSAFDFNQQPRQQHKSRERSPHWK